MNRNRRKSLRIDTSASACIVRLGHGEDQGFVIDESEEGIRIGGLDLLILFADQKVTVFHDRGQVIGRCRVVVRDDNGLFQVGIFRETESFEENPQSLLLNSFMRTNEINQVCVPIDVVDEHHVRIRQLDGREANVKRSELFQLTRSERMEELCDDSRLSAIMQLYSMTSSSNEFTNRESVLNYEFGPPVRSLLVD